MPQDFMLKEVKTKIAGDIVLSENPGKSMRKWRELFNISQIELAERMGVSASVISDYESGRRRSPGARFVKRFVDALIEIDLDKGSQSINNLLRLFIGSDKLYEAVLDMREFSSPISIGEFCEAIKSELIVGKGEVEDKVLLGYTVVDSIKLVLEVPSHDYVRLYGATTQRAAVFTQVYYGRSPMVAIKAMQAGMGGLRPALVVYHGIKKVDRLGLEIARREKIPLALCPVKDVASLLDLLRKIE